MLTFEWRGTFDNAEFAELRAAGFGAGPAEDWVGQVRRHSLGWVCARDRDGLAGFVNVVWDGGIHAFLLDTMVADRVRRQGVGVGLLAEVTDRARAAGCEWLHVDFEEHLRPFYLEAAGFTAAAAGVLRLSR